MSTETKTESKTEKKSRSNPDMLYPVGGLGFRRARLPENAGKWEILQGHSHDGAVIHVEDSGKNARAWCDANKGNYPAAPKKEKAPKAATAAKSESNADSEESGSED